MVYCNNRVVIGVIFFLKECTPVSCVIKYVQVLQA